MAEEAHVIRGINWRETFPFINIFRAFRVAIHPSKLFLALMALLLLYAGGRVLDAIWPASQLAVVEPPTGTGVEAASERRMGSAEVSSFELYQRGQLRTPAGSSLPAGLSFADWRRDKRLGIEKGYAQEYLLAPVGGKEALYKPDQRDEALAQAHRANHLGDIKSRLIDQREEQIKQADEAYKKAIDDANKLDASAKSNAIAEAEKVHKATVQGAFAQATAEYQRAATIKGQGIFSQFFFYEVEQINGVVYGVIGNNWLGGLHDPGEGRGVLRSAANFLTVGPIWMLQQHSLYFFCFLILFLIIWALFGGAIARIAAVHVARDEKLSVRQALRFSASKFLSFIFAPIIPLAIVLVVGFIVLVGGLVGNLPGGSILVGLFFFLALGAGFVMTLVLLGTAGGFNLMYPTIAVEGSDSFDAISRSFSYVYARPWRMAFYTILAVIYGALTYLFVHLFVVLMLGLTHYFVGAGFFVDGRNMVPAWDSIWPMSPARLSYEVDYLALRWDRALGAGLIAFWVYLTVSIVGAYAISFYFSANTIIYYLMRREVDATEMDDVYLEQSDEEFTEPAPGPDAGTVPPPTAPPADAAPPLATPAGSPMGGTGIVTPGGVVQTPGNGSPEGTVSPAAADRPSDVVPPAESQPPVQGG